MADTTFEEAARCPKCGEPGKSRLQQPIAEKPGAKLHHVYCENKRCEWYNTPWLVQVNADGSIPPPQDHRTSPKIYEGFDDHDEIAQRVINSLTLQTKLETEQGGHGEIRNPHGS